MGQDTQQPKPIADDVAEITGELSQLARRAAVNDAADRSATLADLARLQGRLTDLLLRRYQDMGDGGRAHFQATLDEIGRLIKILTSTGPLVRPAARQPCVLIVEDEPLTALDLEAVLADAGYAIDGPVSNVGDAEAAARQDTIDAALLDIHIHGANIFPVADILAGRGVPFMFLTGRVDVQLPPRHRDRPVLTKPWWPHSLLAALARIQLQQPVP